MQVLKRDKSIEQFSYDKIEKAIQGAYADVNIDYDPSIMNVVKQKFSDVDPGTISIEEIEDTVEKILSHVNFDVCRAYIIYRYNHKLFRDEKNDFVKKLTAKLGAKDVDNQNANVDEHSFGGRLGEATRVVTKQLALGCMSKMSRNNHLKNEIYVHDLDHYYIGDHNCLSVPFDELLSGVIKTRQADIRPARSVNTAFQLVAVAFQLQSLVQFGGVSATHLDWTLVPYVRMSFFKHFVTKYIEENIKEDEEITSELKEKLKKEFKEKYHIEDEDFKIGDFSMKCINFHVDDPRIKEINPQWYKDALFETKEEIKQAVEGMYHNLNTLQSRSGNQLPFTSINYGTCTLPEGRMITKALLLGSLEGTGPYHNTSIFPCGIFQCMKGVNRAPGDPNYDLFLLALESTSKRLYPNFCNVDWSNNAGYDRNDPRTYVSTMGCRTYNGADINAEPGVNPQRKDGRGNLAPVTIILPTLAMEVKVKLNKEKENLTEEEYRKALHDNFMRYLDKKIHEAKDMLLERFERMASQDSKSASFMWENNTMFGYHANEGIVSALRHGTLAVGQLGLAECLQILIGTDQTTEAGMNLAKEIEAMFNRRCSEFKKDTHLNFGVYYTPRRDCGRLCK